MANAKSANELFRKVADIEAALIYTEPPYCPGRVVEAWTSTALALGDYKTAERAYREAFSREPGSGRAYFDLAGTFRGQSKTEDARRMEARACEAWDKADGDLPQLRASMSPSSGNQR